MVTDILKNVESITPDKGKTSDEFLADQNTFIKVKSRYEINYNGIKLNERLVNDRVRTSNFEVANFQGILYNKDKGYLLYDKLEEQELTDFNNLNTCYELGVFLAKIHYNSLTYEDSNLKYAGWSHRIDISNYYLNFITNTSAYKIGESYHKREEISEYLINNVIGASTLLNNLLKTLVHRDISIFNIVTTSEKNYLIDFDFARESCIGDDFHTIIYELIKYYGLESAAYFFQGYIENIYYNEVDHWFFSFGSTFKDENYYGIVRIILTYCITYLCGNAFPYYMKDSLTEENFKFLVDQRNEKLDTLFNNFDKLPELMTQIAEQ